jgi:hypothetical protein
MVLGLSMPTDYAGGVWSLVIDFRPEIDGTE